MLTDLEGNPIAFPPRAVPPATDPASDEDSRLSALKGDRSHAGGTSSSVPEQTPYNRFIQRRLVQDRLLKKTTADEQMVDRVMRRLDALDAFLDDDQMWWEKLQKASLRDLAIYEGVYIDKLQALRGQATQVISVQHQEKLDQVLPLLLQVMQQRGLTMTATETKRTIEAKVE